MIHSLNQFQLDSILHLLERKSCRIDPRTVVISETFTGAQIDGSLVSVTKDLFQIGSDLFHVDETFFLAVKAVFKKAAVRKKEEIFSVEFYDIVGL